MNAYDDMKAAGMLRFESITCKLDSSDADIHESSTAGPVCVPKTPGQARFTIQCNNLINLPVANFNFDTGEEQDTTGFDFPIEFVADAPTILTSGDAVVHWTVNQSIGRDVHLFGYDAHLDSVSGGITTLIKQRRPYTSDTACSGGSRWTGADITSHAGENALTFKGNASVSGFHPDFNAAATNFVVTGSAAEDVSFDIIISEIRDSCGIGAAAGGTPRLHAYVQNAQPGDAVQWKWEVSNNLMVLGGDNLPIFRFQLPDPTTGASQSCDVTLHATVAGVPADGALSYSPTETADSVAVKQRLCRFRRIWQSLTHPYANPLWDPLRDLVAQPLSLAEIDRIGRAGAALVEIADDLRRVQERIAGYGRFG